MHVTGHSQAPSNLSPVKQHRVSSEQRHGWSQNPSRPFQKISYPRPESKPGSSCPQPRSTYRQNYQEVDIKRTRRGYRRGRELYEGRKGSKIIRYNFFAIRNRALLLAGFGFVYGINNRSRELKTNAAVPPLLPHYSPWPWQRNQQQTLGNTHIMFVTGLGTEHCTHYIISMLRSGRRPHRCFEPYIYKTRQSTQHWS